MSKQNLKRNSLEGILLNAWNKFSCLSLGKANNFLLDAKKSEYFADICIQCMQKNHILTWFLHRT